MRSPGAEAVSCGGYTHSSEGCTRPWDPRGHSTDGMPSAPVPCSVPGAAGTNHRMLTGLKQPRFILSQFWRSEAQNGCPWANTELWPGLGSLEPAREGPSSPFQLLGAQASLPSGLCLQISWSPRLRVGLSGTTPDIAASQGPCGDPICKAPLKEDLWEPLCSLPPPS